jgi:hypothetical protein
VAEMKNLILKLNALPLKTKAALGAAVLLTISLLVAVPSAAWFYSQRKAAEMYKVEYPNSLYLNAAQREDRMYFNMNAISPYKTDPVTGGLVHDEDGKLIPVESQLFVFSVSGSNTKNYKLQMAHTNNNQLSYKIYPAKQYSSQDDIPSGTDDDDIVMYSAHENSHTENAIQVTDDIYSETGSKYYVKESSVLAGGYKNNVSINPMQAKDNDTFYYENYQDSTNVQTDVIPSYWQSDSVSVNMDSNNKFCDYYIIEVTWENRSSVEDKETDMIYITAAR